ncbi:MAG: competence/damage-inducible protein A [Nitrospirae bacterium]|nr:competence/damage-inducible protein A [Nitrospirota bacterium]MBF0536253.1 competence/damage-inducible protein A [Nitrospirota bacterium]MBF0615813.1 competence/damage-inducible protein A [Nitrospirota bacterium]
MPKTAGIVIIGDEVLSGKVEECNAYYMAKGLRAKGIIVRRISVIPDEVPVIAGEVKKFAADYDIVFTSGGLGPTHDDVTIEGIAKGFGVHVVTEHSLHTFLYNRYGSKLTPERSKMAEVPEGATVISHEDIRFPLIKFKNIYILPGLPEFLRDKFDVIISYYNENPIALKKVYFNEYESELAPFINEVVSKNPDVKIGSYPVLNEESYMVYLTLESFDSSAVDRAVDMITQSKYRDKIVQIK